jgi:hypothetical protein
MRGGQGCLEIATVQLGSHSVPRPAAVPMLPLRSGLGEIKKLHQPWMALIGR